MIKDIVKDTQFLQRKSVAIPCIEDEKQLYKDLIDTAEKHRNTCVGLAAPQIGVLKKAIVVLVGGDYRVMVNPTIFAKSKETYIATESCLSLEGERMARRHNWIKVAYATPNGKQKQEMAKGFVAQIIQHEWDHLSGILI